MAGRTWIRTIAIALLVAAVSLALDMKFAEILTDGSLRQLLMLTACNVLVAVSLNVINGMAGQFSIGHAGFIGLGAYTAAVVASQIHVKLGSHTPTLAASFIVVPVALLASALVAGSFGFLLGLPSLRLKGDYLAIVTLGFAEIFRLLIATATVGVHDTPAQAWSAVRGPGTFFHALSVSITALGGQNGYAGPGDQGVPLYAGPFWILTVVALMVALAWRIKFSGWGRALRALREDEIASAAVGVDPTRYKVTSFVLAAVGAGVAGGLLAMMRDGTPSVQPDTFNFQASFDAITMVILGGSGSVTGAMLGGIFVTLSIKAIEYGQGSSFVQDLRRHAEWLDLNALRMMLYSALLIALMILRPEGLLGERELFQSRAKRPS
jgi:branched-chain amino acid transport system permease protein